MDSYADQSKIPVVELTSTNSSLGTSSWRLTSDAVRNALETYGCLVVSYEQMGSEEMQSALFGLWGELFDLPIETKMKHTSQLAGFGYGGCYASMPLFECFGIESDGSLEGVQEFAKLMWPHGHHKFCETVVSYSKMLMELSNTIIKMWMSSYGVEKHSDPITESSLYMTRLIRYRSPDKTDDNLGLKAHRDKSFVSILGSNEVKGLQIETRHGQWIEFEPSPSKFIVLVGEAFMAWSNGRLYCPQHRVIARGYQERHSIGFFSFIRGTLQVPDELVDDQNPLKFKPFNNLEFLKFCEESSYSMNASIQAYCGI